MPNLEIVAMWDEDAKVWVATSDDVPGLATEADTLDVLIDKLKVIAPELLEANGRPVDGVLFTLRSERTIPPVPT